MARRGLTFRTLKLKANSFVITNVFFAGVTETRETGRELEYPLIAVLW